MFFSKFLIFIFISVFAVASMQAEGEIPVIDTNRIDRFKEDFRKIIKDVRWAIGIYSDAKGSYQQLDKLLGDVYSEINGLISGELFESIKESWESEIKGLINSTDYFKMYITGRFGQVLNSAISLDEYFESDEELEGNMFLQNPIIMKQFEEIKEIKNELKSTIEESLELLSKVGELQELIDSDGELQVIEDLVKQTARLEKSSETTNTDSFWAVYAAIEYKRMVKLFATYAMLEQKRKEAIHKDLLRVRGYATQLSGGEEK